MKAINQYLEEALKNNSNVSLAPFDPTLYDKYATKEDEKFVHFYPKLKTTHFNHTILIGKEKAGLICFEKISSKPIRGIPQLQIKGNGGFIHVLIFEKFRGKGLLKTSEDLLAKEYNADVLWGIIKKRNIASIKAHKKIGWKTFPQKQINQWIKNKEIKDTNIVMYKKY